MVEDIRRKCDPKHLVFSNISLIICDIGNPSVGRLNARGVAELAILDPSKAISQKWCKIGGKLILITNRKLYMSFRLVPKLVTLKGVMTLFCVISPNSKLLGTLRKCYVVIKKVTFAMSSPDEFLVTIYIHVPEDPVLYSFCSSQPK